MRMLSGTMDRSSKHLRSQSCSHGTDKDVYVSVPCVLGREGVHAIVRQTLNDQEKTAVQRCADDIRGVLRECGILRERTQDVEEWRAGGRRDRGGEEGEKREGSAKRGIRDFRREEDKGERTSNVSECIFIDKGDAAPGDCSPRVSAHLIAVKLK